MISPYRSKNQFGNRVTISVEVRFWVSVMLALVLYFIAGSIGSGWMYLLSSATIMAIFCGWLWPVLSLRNIDVRVDGPDSCSDGEPIQITVELCTKPQHAFLSKLFPPAMVLIKQSLPPELRGGGSERSGSLYLNHYDALLEEIGTPANPTRLQFRKNGLPRGVHPLGFVSLRTSFPLGLLWRERSFTSDRKVTVYPRINPMEGFFLYRIKAIGSTAFGMPKEGTTAQSIFTRGVRNYVRGDSPRNIHWMSTARMGRLMVREFDAEGLPYFDVQLDLSAKWFSAQQFELAVATAASLIALGQRMGLSAELNLIPSLNELELELPAVLPGYELNMEILARVMPVVAGENKDASAFCQTKSEERATVVIVPQGELSFEPDNSFVVEISKLARITTPYSSDGRSALDEAVVNGNHALIARLEDISLL